MGFGDWAPRAGVGRVGKEEERITSAFSSSSRLIISRQVGSPWERRHNFTSRWTVEAASASWRLARRSSGRPRGYALLQDLSALSTAMKTSKQRWATCAWMVEWTRRNTNIYTRWLTVCPLVDLLRVWGVSFLRCTAESWQEVICWYFSSSIRKPTGTATLKKSHTGQFWKRSKKKCSNKKNTGSLILEAKLAQCY